ncbi:putative E3 ubiquitin-protein ligase UPL7 [Nannochloris sp. 'desiccata']|nr:putative E3 ubiquitin-protein ligase UPL7 [Chlorella desiccata (nom. nud.)]
MSWQPGSAAHKVALRGSSKQEATSKQILEQAKEERRRRKREKDEPRAAIQLQRHWRGQASRQAARLHLQSEWIRRYGSLASQPTANFSAADLVSNILPMAMFALLPPPGSAQRTALESGGQLLLPPLDTYNDKTNTGASRTCLRGTISILLKHLSSTRGNPQQGLLGYSSFESDSTASASLSSIVHRVIALCCACIGGDTSSIDALTQTAAARVVALLTTAARAQQSSNALGLFESSGEELLMWLAGTPMISLACRRVLDALESGNSGGGSGGGRSGNAAPASSSASSSSSSGQLQMALNNLLTAQFHVIDGTSHCLSEEKKKKRDAGDNQTQDGGGGVQHCSFSLPLGFFVSHVFTGPELIHHIQGTNALNRMLEEASFCLLADCLTEQLHAESLSKKKKTPEFSPLNLLTNLTALFVRPRKGDGSFLASQEASKLAFSRATDALMAVLQRENIKSHSSSESFIRVFGDGTVALKLQSAMDLSKFCELYCCLLEITDTCTASACGTGAGQSLRLLSALAFGSSGEGKEALLPKSWHHLAVAVGLPIEISAVATKFEVSSLPLGVHSVPSSAQQPFLLFCRAMAHYLSTTDDVEFYEEQGLFTLAAQRAVGVGLCTLIFNTHLPRSKSSSSSSTSTVDYGTSKKLLHHAPRLLRALFDRDTRRQFCPPALWLGPYSELVRTGGVDVSGAAVLRALLQGDRSASQEEGEGEGDRQEVGRQQRSHTPSSPPSPPSSSSSASGLAAVLLSAPQLIPFEERVEVFRGLVAVDKHARRYHLAPVDGGPRPLKVVIRRSRLLEDALATLIPAGGGIRGPLRIEFINAQGMLEAGIDMGGLTKELLDRVTAALIQPERGVFTQSTTSGQLYPHPLAQSLEEGPSLFTLAGLVLGKALYEGILLPAPLAAFFIARLQGRLPTLDDLAALDPEVHRNLIQVKRYESLTFEADLGLDFTLETDTFGAKIIEELIPGGANIPVTSANKLQYVHLVADWHLRRRLGPSAAAFSSGLARVFPLAWLKLFSAREVNLLLGGGDGGDVDLEDLKRHTHYSGGYSASSKTVQLFWTVFKKLGPDDRRAVLRFATSSSRAPLGGFVHLSPPFTLHKVDCGGAPLAIFGVGKDADRLPSASTCSNTLKLPNFKREATLREKLLYAIRSGAGFDLS